MTERLARLADQVEKLYLGRNPNADPWAEWAYPNHVLVVAQEAEKLAVSYGANAEFCVAGGLLHDIADAVMHRADPNHEPRSLELARELLSDAGFGAGEIQTIVEEIIAPHSCGERKPEIMEAKVVATADGMSHFTTDFFLYFCWMHFGAKDGRLDYPGFREWVRGKIEKHWNKLFFDDARERVRPDYEALQRVFAQ